MKKKTRVGIPKDIATECLYSSDRTCCVCCDPGKPIQLHHIDENPANNLLENLAVLCLHCHEQTQITGGFGRKLDAQQVVRYRHAWLERVAHRREQADALAIQTINGVVSVSMTNADHILTQAPIPLADYVALLPNLLERSYASAQAGWQSGITAEMMNASYGAVAALEGMLNYLMEFYPNGHFDDRIPKDYVSEIISFRYGWHRRTALSGSDYEGGTIIGPIVAARVLSDLEKMVEDLVEGLSGQLSVKFNFCSWKKQWNLNAIGSLQGEAQQIQKSKTSPFYEKPSYWIKTNEGKDGPFCQKCFDADQKMIRLQGGCNDKWLCHACKSYFYGPNYQPPQRKVISNGWKAWT